MGEKNRMHGLQIRASGGKIADIGASEEEIEEMSKEEKIELLKNE